MRATLTIALAAALVASVAACTTERAPEKAPPPAVTPVAEHKAITTEKLEPYECGSITRLHTFAGVFVGSQPKPADFEQAKKGGVKTVLNLRHATENTEFDEAKIVGDVGLKYVNIPWNGPEELTDQVFDRARDVLNTGERPILMHCASANRAGAIWLAWRAVDGRLPIEDAVAEAKTVGLHSSDFESKARDYVARHVAPR